MRLALAATLVLLSSAAVAQYPAKPIRIVVPYPPGGIDPALRIMAPKMTELLGQSLVIENRAGANGLIGSENVARSPADGYTLLFATSSTLVGGVLLMKDAKIDPVKDFTPISNLFGNLRTITVHSSLPVSTLKELVDYAKKNPGKLSYGSSGIGSTFHLDGEIFKQAAGVDVVHVPYSGTGPLSTALLAGQVEVGIMSLVNVRQHVAAGKLKLVAIMEEKRHPGMPDVPTAAEIYPGAVKSGAWVALLGPAGLPRPVVQRVHEAAIAAMNTREVRDYHDKNGAVIEATSPEALAAAIRTDLEKTAKLLKSIGLAAQ
jgi:tripartite-type tricarboxylate transporter receptor subunit TctC